MVVVPVFCTYLAAKSTDMFHNSVWCVVCVVAVPFKSTGKKRYLQHNCFSLHRKQACASQWRLGAQRANIAWGCDNNGYRKGEMQSSAVTANQKCD